MTHPPRRGFAGPTKENLPSLARLAYRLSAQHCTTCRDYHVMWPYLRSLGLQGGGPEHRFAEQRATFAAAAGDRDTVRWLIAGTADAGQLALVESVASLRAEVRHSIAIVDRCATPLGVARAHAETSGLDLETVRADLMAFDRQGAFDVVSMHHVIDFFAPEVRASFLRRAATWLAPKGHVLITLNFGPKSVASGRSEARRAWREAGIRRAAASGDLDLPEDLETFVRRLDGLRDSRKGVPRLGHDRGYYEALVAEAGLAVTDIVALPFDDEERARHGGSPRERCIIMAARP